MKKLVRIFVIVMALSCLLLTSCGDKDKKESSAPSNKEASKQEETDKSVKETESTGESDTTEAENEDGEKTTELTEDETEAPEETEEEKEKIEEDDVGVEVPKYTNPLTGLATKYDITKKRPVSIMINNIGVSLPQEGIGQADILYECLAEGGITRLMMITTYYDEFTKVGSVRSARDYFIDYAEGYNAIFVHAGGSPYAYDTIYGRGVDNVDGVNGSAALYYTFYTFQRDPERLKHFATEHTLVVKSGLGLVNGIAFYGYSTELAAGYEEPMHYVEYGKITEYDNKATHAKVVVSGYQTVDYVYNEEDHKYYRYQYNGTPHVDGTTGDQLSFKNVIVIFTYTSDIPGDTSSRIDIGTTGTGSGWYITEGSYTKITWRKDTETSILKFYYEDGTEVELNRGKSMINVVPTYNAPYVTFDNEWN